MKIGDIVSVTILQGNRNKAIDKGKILDIAYNRVWVEFAGNKAWFNKEDLESVNCSVGKSWSRYIINYGVFGVNVWDAYYQRRVV
jgi:hypothetical protein